MFKKGKFNSKGFNQMFKKGINSMARVSKSLGAVSELANQASAISNPDSYKGYENKTLKEAYDDTLQKAKNLKKTGQAVATPYMKGGLKAPSTTQQMAVPDNKLAVM